MLRLFSAGSNRLGKLSLPCHLERMPAAFCRPEAEELFGIARI
jgi:hypothetical protein